MRYVGDARHLFFPDDVFDTIITDPPWWFHARGPKALAAAPYDLMPMDEVFLALSECWRVLKPNGYLLLFCPPRLLDEIVPMLVGGHHLVTWNYNGNVVWDKKSFGLGSYFRNAHEHILVLSKGKGRKFQNASTPSILRYKNPGKTRKPVELYQKLLDATTPSGGLVLDPFCGGDPLSKTTGFETCSGDIEEVFIHDQKEEN